MEIAVTDDERKAMEWLERAAEAQGPSGAPLRTLKAMLARPLMPEEPTPAALKVMKDAWSATTPLENGYASEYRALYAHLTAPKTKEVEVWHVEFANNHGCAYVSVRSSRDLAENLAELYRQHGHTCIRVTGPHKQKVPT